MASPSSEALRFAPLARNTVKVVWTFSVIYSLVQFAQVLRVLDQFPLTNVVHPVLLLLGALLPVAVGFLAGLVLGLLAEIAEGCAGRA